jgi:hypothetical protein
MIDEDSDKPGTASEAPTSSKSKGASPAALSRFVKEQPKLRVDKMLRSHSAQQLQPSKKKSAKSKKVKEAEDVPSGSPGKRPRARGKTMSLEEDFFLDELDQNFLVGDSDKPDTAPKAPTSAKPKGASPAALSRFAKEQSKSSVSKKNGSRSVQYQPPTVLAPVSRSVQYQPPTVLAPLS